MASIILIMINNLHIIVSVLVKLSPIGHRVADKEPLSCFQNKRAYFQVKLLLG